MFNLLSILCGVIALPIMLIALIPFLGWLNYLVILLTVIGIALGSVADSKGGRNLNIVILVVGGIRLAMGHFIL